MTTTGKRDAVADEPAAAEGGIAATYDAMAEGYVRHWAPVLREAAEALLDHLDGAVGEAVEARGRARILDVGSGTGTLALAALRRWPDVRVLGIDPSAGMLDVAQAHAATNLPREVAANYETAVAYADELPESALDVDAAMSSFVLQLVASRAAALREIRRALRPGGVFAWVAWLRTDRAFEPDRVANAVLDDFGFDPPEPDRRPGDLASTAAAALAMRRAGFRDVRAWAGEAVHAWDPRGYLEFLTGFDEASLFDDLEPGERRAIEARILDGLERLDPTQLALRLPVVYALGRNPG